MPDLLRFALKIRIGALLIDVDGVGAFGANLFGSGFHLAGKTFTLDVVKEPGIFLQRRGYLGCLQSKHLLLATQSFPVEKAGFVVLLLRAQDSSKVEGEAGDADALVPAELTFDVECSA